MRGFSGADPAALDDLAGAMGKEGSRLHTVEAITNGLVNGAVWMGADADQFAADWRGRMRPQLLAAQHLLEEMDRELRVHASEQRAASDGSGGGSFTHVGGSSAIDHAGGFERLEGLEAGTVAKTSQYATAISELDVGEIGLRKLGGDPPRYVLMLRGLDYESSGSNDLGTSAMDLAGFNSDYQNAIRRVIAEHIPEENAQIAVIGHSQGGMAAVEVAQGEPRISDLITLGSPIDDKNIPSTVNFSQSIVREGDHVTQLEGLDRIAKGPVVALAEALRSTRNAPEMTFTNACGHDSHSPLTGAHGLTDHYLPALKAVEDGGGHGVTVTGGDASASLTLFAHRFGGGAESQAGIVISP